MTQSNGHDSDPPNLETLIKCMKMTTHENDNQALVALRAANRQVAKFGGDWETILRGKVKIIGDPFSGISMPQASESRRAASAPQPPPRPRAPQPPPPPYTGARTYSPPPKPTPPSHGARRPLWSTVRACATCGKPITPNTGEERYDGPSTSWKQHHQPGLCPRRDHETTNKYAGTCTLCSQRVEIGQGTAYHNGTKWRTEHLKGACPAPTARKRRQPLTSDDLMS